MENEDNLLGEFKEPPVESGYFKKLFLGVVDGAIVYALFYMLYRFLPYDLQMNTIRAIYPGLVFLGMVILYRLIALFGFNQTIGMRVLKIQYLTKDHHELSSMQKLMATFLIFTDQVKHFDKK